MLHAQALRALGHSPSAIAASSAALPAAIALSSGSAATASVVSTLAARGRGNGVSHILSVGDVYGGSSRYMLRVAGEQQGIDTTFVDMAYRATEGGAWDLEEMERDIERRVVQEIRPQTKVGARRSLPEIG